MTDWWTILWWLFVVIPIGNILLQMWLHGPVGYFRLVRQGFRDWWAWLERVTRDPQVADDRAEIRRHVDRMEAIERFDESVNRRLRRIPPPPPAPPAPPEPHESSEQYFRRTGHLGIPYDPRRPPEGTDRFREWQEGLMQAWMNATRADESLRQQALAVVNALTSADRIQAKIELRRRLHELQFNDGEIHYLWRLTVDNPGFYHDASRERRPVAVAIPPTPAPNNFRQIELEPRDGE